jgi:inner membrane protein
MTARTHDMFALASLVTAANYFPPASVTLATIVTSMVGCIVGSLIPDMDQATNRLWDLVPGGDFTGRIFKKFLLSHRTLSHSLLGTYLFYLLLNWLLPKIFNSQYIDPQIVVFSVMIGFISHLLADSLTTEGLPLFFPLGFKIGFPPLTSLRIKTGNWIENLIIFPGILIYLFVFITAYQDRLLILLKSITV